MAQRWSVDRVLAVAPNAAAATNGRRLADPAPWRDLGGDGAMLWGDCQGSGRTPYRVSIDVEAPRYDCTCPSRQTPCKHALGLLFLWAENRLQTDGTVRPAHLRRDRASPQQPGAEAEQTPEQRAAAGQRAAQRAERITDGMVELDRWLADQIRTGLARASADPYGWAEPVAARMIDAQAPGVANWLRRLPAVIASGSGWPDRLLTELADLHLLARAWAQLGELPDDLAATVRSRVGLTVPRADVLATPAVRDRWVAVGVRDLDEEQVSTRRVWLRGQNTGRWAVVLIFSVNGAPYEMPLLPGTAREADLHYYPGRAELRALLGTSHTDAELVTDWQIDGGGIAAATNDWRAALAADPWTRQRPVLLTGTVAVGVRGGSFGLIDKTGATVPLTGPEEVIWRLLALTAASQVTVFGEWSTAGLMPGSIVAGGAVLPL